METTFNVVQTFTVAQLVYAVRKVTAQVHKSPVNVQVTTTSNAARTFHVTQVKAHACGLVAQAHLNQVYAQVQTVSNVAVVHPHHQHHQVVKVTR